MELARDIELIFTMDDTADAVMAPRTTTSDSGFLRAPASPSFEMDRGRTRSRSIPRLTSQPRNSRADDRSSMCRGRTRRRSISPAPGLCSCSCACGTCSAVALELCGPSGALGIPLASPTASSHCSGPPSTAMPLSPTRVFLHQISFGNHSRRRDAAPCRDPECNKKRMGTVRHHGSSILSSSPSSPRYSSVHRPRSSIRRASSRSRSRSSAGRGVAMAGIDSALQAPMSAKSFTSMSRLRYQVLVESGHSDEECDDDIAHVGSPDVPSFDMLLWSAGDTTPQ